MYDPSHRPTLGDGEKVKYFSVDKAGNAEAVKTSRAASVPRVAADSRPPSIEVLAPREGAVYRQNAPVVVAFSCSDRDGKSDVRSCAGREGARPVANASRVDTATPGLHAFTVDASDQAGNRSTRTVHYRVRRAVAQLRLTTRASRRHVRIGHGVVYVLEVRNLGPDDATGVVLRDRLAGQMSLTSVRSPDGVTCKGHRLVVCRLGTIEVGGSTTVTLALRATRTGTATNRAGVSSRQSPATAQATRSTSRRPRAAANRSIITTKVLRARGPVA